MQNNGFLATAAGAVSPNLLSNPGQATAGGTYMAKLGDFMFSLDTAPFQQLQRTSEYRWAMLNRIGREPAAQFTGLGEDSIELTGAIYPHFRGGLTQIGTMRTAAAKGEALPLVYGFDNVGQFCGNWVIKSVREGRTEFLRNGSPRKIEFTLSLLAYGADKAPGANAAVSVPGLPSIPGVGSAISAPAGLGGGLVSGLIKSASSVMGLPNISSISSLSDVVSVASAVKNVANSVSNIAGNVKGLVSTTLSSLAQEATNLLPADAQAAAKGLVKTASAVMDAASAAKGAADLFKGNPAGLLSTAGKLNTSMQTLAQASALHTGTVKAAAASMASAPSKPGVSDTARLQAGAALGNIAQQGGNLQFGCTEGKRQTQGIMGVINV